MAAPSTAPAPATSPVSNSVSPPEAINHQDRAAPLPAEPFPATATDLEEDDGTITAGRRGVRAVHPRTGRLPAEGVAGVPAARPPRGSARGSTGRSSRPRVWGARPTGQRPPGRVVENVAHALHGRTPVRDHAGTQRLAPSGLPLTTPCGARKLLFGYATWEYSLLRRPRIFRRVIRARWMSITWARGIGERCRSDRWGRCPL